jgi:hypothetical protein
MADGRVQCRYCSMSLMYLPDFLVVQSKNRRDTGACDGRLFIVEGRTDGRTDRQTD